MRWSWAAFAGIVAATAAAPALAQVSAGVEATTDERRRGLGWSEGEAALSADASAAVAGFDLSARAVTLRGSARHDGADAVFDVEAGRAFALGPFSLRARAVGHLFAGAGARMDYYEMGGTAGYSLGPLSVEAGATYAPDQRAIGGDNLYLFAGASAGIPATPLTVSAAIGRSSGHTDDPVRAARLRPAGGYHDWRVGVEHVTGPLTLALDYVGTDIDARAAPSPLADARHAGDKIVGRVQLGF